MGEAYVWFYSIRGAVRCYSLPPQLILVVGMGSLGVWLGTDTVSEVPMERGGKEMGGGKRGKEQKRVEGGRSRAKCVPLHTRVDDSLK